MEEAGKPFDKLSPAQIAAVLRKYETARSHRVAQIIEWSAKTGNIFRRAGFLVRGPVSPTVTKTNIDTRCPYMATMLICEALRRCHIG